VFLFGFLTINNEQLKMEAAWSSETLTSNHHITGRNSPENHEFYLQSCENFESQNHNSDCVILYSKVL